MCCTPTRAECGCWCPLCPSSWVVASPVLTSPSTLPLQASEEANLMSVRAFLAEEHHQKAEAEAARAAVEVEATRVANLARLAKQEADAAVRAARVAQRVASIKAMEVKRLARAIGPRRNGEDLPPELHAEEGATGPPLKAWAEGAEGAGIHSSASADVPATQQEMLPDGHAAALPPEASLIQAAAEARGAAERATQAAAKAATASESLQAAAGSAPIDAEVTRRDEARLRAPREFHACSNLTCVAMRFPPWRTAPLRPKRRVPKLWVTLAKLDDGGGAVPHETLFFSEPLRDTSTGPFAKAGSQRKLHAFAPRRVHGDHTFVELFQGPPHVCHACECASVAVLTLDARQACRSTREILGRLPLQAARAPFLRPAGIFLALQLPEAAGLFAASLIRLFGYLSPSEAVGADPGAGAVSAPAPAPAGPGSSQAAAAPGSQAQLDPELTTKEPGSGEPNAVSTIAAAAAVAQAPLGPAYKGEDLPISAQVDAYCEAMSALDRRVVATEVRAALEAAWLSLATIHLRVLMREFQKRVLIIGIRHPARKLKLTSRPARAASALLLAKQQLQLFKQGIVNQHDPPLHFPELSEEERWSVVGEFLRAHVDTLWSDASRDSKAATDAMQLLDVLSREAKRGTVSLDVETWRPPELDKLSDEDGGELIFLPDIWGSCMLKPCNRTSPSPYSTA